MTKPASTPTNVSSEGRPMHVYWRSQHRPTPRQLRALASCKVTYDYSRFENAAEVVRKFRESGAEELILVAPLSVIEHVVLDHRVFPVWAEMRSSRERNEDSEVQFGDRWIGFVKFRRIKMVQKVFEPEDVIFP